MAIETTQPYSPAQAAMLAGAIWIYGGIHFSGKNYVPVILVTMPSPLVYVYQKDFGGDVYRDKEGYFTLQIKRQEEVRQALLAIRYFLSGEEAIQVQLALKLMEVKHSRLLPDEKLQQLKKLTADWKESRNRLEEWMKELVAKHKNDRISENEIPIAIWIKAYKISEFMEESGYDKVSKMQSVNCEKIS